MYSIKMFNIKKCFIYLTAIILVVLVVLSHPSIKIINWGDAGEFQRPLFRYGQHPLKFTQNLSLINLNNTLVNLVKEDLTLLEGAYPAVWIQESGTLTQRLQAMIRMIEKMRAKVINADIGNTWVPMNQKLNVIYALGGDHLRNVSISGDVIPIILPWIPLDGGTAKRPLNTLNDDTNLVIQKYYQWTGHTTLCEWINSGITNWNYHIVHQSNCVSDIRLSIHPESMHLVTLNSRPAIKGIAPWFPAFYYTDLPKHVTYILIAINAVFTLYGDLITGNIKYVPYTCSHDPYAKYNTNFEKASLYEEVFSIAQKYGGNFYHKNIEEFPRMAAYLPWLRKNPQIKIHIMGKDKFVNTTIEYLGISKDRFVLGPMRAKIAYMPETTYCHFDLVTNTQILAENYRNIIHNEFNQTERNSIVLIRRSRKRRFIKHREVESLLKRVAKQHNLTYELFIDNPPPSAKESMEMFNRAVMVVAPHGAGLANLIFSKPETFVIEGVCNRPHVKLCFQRLAYTLGHHYYGIPSSRGCQKSITIQTAEINRAVQYYIKYAIKLRT